MIVCRRENGADPPVRAIRLDSQWRSGIALTARPPFENDHRTGSLTWQVATDCGQRALIETTMGRYPLIGLRLRARGFAARRTEAVIDVAALNRMLAAGRPTSVRSQAVIT